jgi:putative ABC transport system permease protein
LLVNAVVLRSLPFSQPDQIMWVATRDDRGRDLGISIADFEDWQAATRTFSHLSFVFSGSAIVNEQDRIAEQYPGSWVSSNFFAMLGETPQLGRDFSPQDDLPAAAPAIMLSSSLWKNRYGADPSVLGRVLRMNGVTGTIVGVMPDGLTFPNDAEIWAVASKLPAVVRQSPRQARNYYAIGRLADGVTLDQARAELENIGDALAREYPATNANLAPYAEPYAQRITGPQLRLMFWSLMGAVAFVLLIACSNVANLLLTRAARRSHEVSVRAALGATRSGLVRQLLIESVMLAFLAGGLALLVSAAGIRWFDAETQNVGRPSWMEFTMDWRTFAFFLTVCVATGILFGLAPALHVSKTNVYETLKEGGRTGSGGRRARRWTTGLIVAELALTLVLLAGAGLMMRSFLTMYGMDIGVVASRFQTVQLLLPARDYPTMENRATFLRRVDEHLSTIADIEAASTASHLPFGGGAGRQIQVEGDPPSDGRRPTITVLSVGSRYFDTVGIRPVQGRVLSDFDGRPGRDNVVINQRMAMVYFAGQNPLNRRIRLSDGTPATASAPWLTIVGVVPNIRQRNNNRETEPDAVAYIPHLQNITMARTAVILARIRPGSAPPVQIFREAIRAIDPDIAVFNTAPLDEVLAEQRWSLRVFGTMLAAFAVVALVLAAVGVYGVTAYAVTQHTREIGMRMMLGARPHQVIWLFLRQAFVQLAIGLTIGIAAAFAVGRLLQSFLVQVSPRDPVTLVSIVALLTGVALAACVWPVRRVTRLDPLTALRHE